MNIYLQGLTMGLAYVAPIGLQNLFVINSALTQKRSRVYLTALIVILWDVSLGVSCFLGAGALMQAVPWLQKVILGLGSLIVIWIGIGLLRSKASLEGGKDVNVPVWKLFTTAFVVTWFNPQAIIDDIKQGIGKTDGKYVEICDRKEAIAYAIHHGEPGDIIVLAGKGHEDYQEIEGKKYPMDERVLIREILAEDAAKGK